MSDGRSQSIMSIKPGDLVKAIDTSTGHLIDTEVVAILHKDSHKPTMFQVITDTLNTTSISLSPSHLIHVNNAGYVQARKLKLGDRLTLHSDRGLQQVVVGSIRFEIQTGFTAPLTSAGTLLVNGVDASCFAVVNSHRLANLGMMPVKVWYYVSKYIFGGPGQLETNVDIDFYSVGLFRVVSYLMPAIFS